jgi:hypothetical protein
VKQRFPTLSLVLLSFVLVTIASSRLVAEQQHDDKITTPARSVDGQVLSSTGMPSVAIEFDEEFKYAGTQSFVLYDVANCEQHFFVDADDKGRVKGLYWIQFEGYLPDNTKSYNYKVTKTVNIGGLDFIADAYARTTVGSTGNPNSDGNRARAFLESKGFDVADHIMSQRLVHLIGEDKRNELMIIYSEEITSRGLTAADVSEGGRAFIYWDDLAKGLLDRALKNMKLTQK